MRMETDIPSTAHRSDVGFPRPPQADPDGPIEWATFQVGADRMVTDLRGPEPKLRTDTAEVISMERNRSGVGNDVSYRAEHLGLPK